LRFLSAKGAKSIHVWFQYYDFQTIQTDATGGYLATFGIMLPAGPDDVRFFVKDTADFKIVLCHDFFKFSVE
jgi:hypothetical protein